MSVSKQNPSVHAGSINLGFNGDELIEAEKFLEYRDDDGKLYHERHVA